MLLRRSLSTDEARPDREPELAELIEVAHGAVDEHRGNTLVERLGREEVADQRHRGRVGHRQHEHVAGLRARDDCVDHQVVAVPAQRRPCTTGDPRARDDLQKRDVDQAGLALRLVDGRDAETGKLLERRHSASTTCGTSRWKASAYRMSERPEIRRA